MLEATYADRGGLTGRAIIALQPKRKQAEYFTATGRVAGSTATGDPGVQREATGDTAGGFQNIGFIEDGDWWSFAPTNLTNITSLRLRAASGSTGGRVEVRAGSATGTLLATATVPATGAWQTYTDVTVTLPANTTTQPLFFVARPPVGVSNGGGLLNVNWVDFVGAGVGGPTSNTPPTVSAIANPISGTAPLTVAFTGTASDPDGDTPLSYRWDFGDGGSATTQNASRTYTAAGTYTARLTVTDARGATGTATATITVTAPPTTTLSSNVHLFYYPWYGSPAVNGSYRHWQQGGRTPPNDVGADFYPTLGAYDSGDVAGAVNQHMAWVRRSGAGVLVYSWWGQGSYEDNLVTAVMNAANAQGIKVAWHIEPYAGRTAASVVSDIGYINSRYGGHPAFYRSAEHGNRPAFYIFDSLSIANWQPLDPVNDNNIILAQTTDTSRIQYFSGMYTYDVIAGATAPGWEGAGSYAQANNLIWAPSVGPGYIDDRAVPGNTTPTLARNNGTTYDTEWTNALDPTKGGVPTWVSITSFNEWHEGSTIEPARSSPPGGFGYQTYVGAYGLSGAAAETAYLDRTAYWAREFEQRRGGGDVTPPSVPGNLRVTGQTHNTVTLAWDASTGGRGVLRRAARRHGGGHTDRHDVHRDRADPVDHLPVHRAGSRRRRQRLGADRPGVGDHEPGAAGVEPAAQQASDRGQFVRGRRGAGEGGQRHRQRRPHRQVVLARREQVAAGRHRVERLRRPDRGAALGGRRRVRPLEHPRFRPADQHERHDVDDGRGGARQHRGRHDAHVHGGGRSLCATQRPGAHTGR